ncbi:MAG: hypothetical protein DHS20C15_14260 [Planctomycetota bacterium]|nr:MAG: hypothetical protein DHS20C15_14260 [Planctomycetota bacterium]
MTADIDRPRKTSTQRVALSGRARHSPALRRCVALLGWLLAASPALSAQGFEALLPPSADFGPNFGLAVSIEADTALVGARFANDSGPDAGAAFVFTRDAQGGWSTPVELVPVGGSPGDLFGWAVELDGDRAFVGAPSDDSETFFPQGQQAGSVYVFGRDDNGAWQQLVKLRATHELSSNQFGCSIAADDELLLVGARWANVNGQLIAGAAYVFPEVGGSWPLGVRLTASDARASDQFGEAVALSGNTLVIGAKGHDHSALNTNHGAAYVFVPGALPGNWVQQAELRAAQPMQADNLGRALSLDGDRLVVGAPGNGSGVVDSGSALVFERDAGTWTQVAELLPNDGASDDRFGHAVSLRGDRVVVGAFFRDDAAHNSGAGYFFERTAQGDWSRQAKFFTAGGLLGDRLGIALDFDGEQVLLGASGDDTLGEGAGAAYSLPLSLVSPWTDREHALAGTNGAPSLVGLGPLQPDTRLDVLLTGALPESFASLVLGADELGAAFKGGVLVPVPSQVVALRVDADGEAALHGRWPTGVPAGFELVLQTWVVDPGADFGFAASNALRAVAP